VTYAPHFISTVVLVGMILIFLSPRNGIINTFIKALGIEPIFFMGEPRWFKSLYVWSGIWQNAGWGSIIYIATLAGVNPELYEAAIVDGASKLQRIIYIDIPSLIPTATILLILNLGRIMSVGFEKVFLMQNDLNLVSSEIIATYVYKTGLLGAQFSFSSAVGLFNNAINFVLLVIVNALARKYSSTSLW
jgi:putative aldouronate transport system permease protein